MSSILSFKMESGKTTFAKTFSTKYLRDMLIANCAFGVSDPERHLKLAYAANSPILDSRKADFMMIAVHNKWNNDLRVSVVKGKDDDGVTQISIEDSHRNKLSEISFRESDLFEEKPDTKIIGDFVFMFMWGNPVYSSVLDPDPDNGWSHGHKILTVLVYDTRTTKFNSDLDPGSAILSAFDDGEFYCSPFDLNDGECRISKNSYTTDFFDRYTAHEVSAAASNAELAEPIFRTEYSFDPIDSSECQQTVHFLVCWSSSKEFIFDDEYQIIMAKKVYYHLNQFVDRDYEFIGVPVIVLEGLGFPLRAFENPSIKKYNRSSIIDLMDDQFYGDYKTLSSVIQDLGKLSFDLNLWHDYLSQNNKATDVPDLLLQCIPDSIFNCCRSFPSVELGRVLPNQYVTSVIHKTIQSFSDVATQNLSEILKFYSSGTAAGISLQINDIERFLNKLVSVDDWLTYLNPTLEMIIKSTLDYSNSEESSEKVIVVKNGAVRTEKIDLMSLQFSIRGSYYVDSLSMYIYSDDDEGSRGAAASKGLSKKIPRAFGRTLFSGAMLLYARDSESANDPIFANDLDHLLSGYITTIGQADDAKHISAPLYVTHRINDRAYQNPVVVPYNGNYAVIHLMNEIDALELSDGELSDLKIEVVTASGRFIHQGVESTKVEESFDVTYKPFLALEGDNNE